MAIKIITDPFFLFEYFKKKRMVEENTFLIKIMVTLLNNIRQKQITKTVRLELTLTRFKIKCYEHPNHK